MTTRWDVITIVEELCSIFFLFFFFFLRYILNSITAVLHEFARKKREGMTTQPSVFSWERALRSMSSASSDRQTGLPIHDPLILTKIAAVTHCVVDRHLARIVAGNAGTTANLGSTSDTWISCRKHTSASSIHVQPSAAQRSAQSGESRRSLLYSNALLPMP